MEKIIIATDAWHPQVSGVVRCVEEAKKFLEKNNFEVTIIHPGLFRTFPVFFYPEICLSIFPRRKIEKIFEEKKPDYVHIVTEGTIGLATRSICLKRKFKFTTSYHTHYQYYIQYYIGAKIDFLFKIIDAYLLWFNRASEKTMVITERFKRELGERGYKNLSLWPLGTDVEFFKRNENSSIKKDYNLKSPVFVYFGRLSKEKNVEEYLQCNLPGTKLVIGDGPNRCLLEKKYGKDALFVGYKKGKELIDFLSVCDVFVFPSLTDTFPLAIIEALSCGIPVAAHNVMGLEDTITSDVGFLDENLERTAIACLNISREKCREKALKFSWEKSSNYFMQSLVKIK